MSWGALNPPPVSSCLRCPVKSIIKSGDYLGRDMPKKKFQEETGEKEGRRDDQREEGR